MKFSKTIQAVYIYVWLMLFGAILSLFLSCSTQKYYPRIKGGGPCRQNEGFSGYGSVK